MPNDAGAGTRAGIIADGVVKALLGAVLITGAGGGGELLGVDFWLMVMAGVVLVASGGIELKYLRSRPAGTYLRLMVAYDGGWVLATLVGLALTWLGGGAGGEVWLGYQVFASVAFAAVLVASGSGRVAAKADPA